MRPFCIVMAGMARGWNCRSAQRRGPRCNRLWYLCLSRLGAATVLHRLRIARRFELVDAATVLYCFRMSITNGFCSKCGNAFFNNFVFVSYSHALSMVIACGCLRQIFQETTELKIRFHHFGFCWRCQGPSLVDACIGIEMRHPVRPPARRPSAAAVTGVSAASTYYYYF